MIPLAQNYSECLRVAAADFAQKASDKLFASLSCGGATHLGMDHSVAWRIKSDKAVKEKLSRSSSVDGKINDFVGLRILVAHIGLIEQAEILLSQWERELGLQRVSRKDLFASSGESGYRAVHFDYELICPETMGLSSYATVELQMTTWLQHLHGALSHKRCYKSRECSKSDITMLRSLSDRLHMMDREIASLLQPNSKKKSKSREEQDLEPPA